MFPGRTLLRRRAQYARAVGSLVNRPFRDGGKFIAGYHKVSSRNRDFLNTGPSSLASIIAPYKKNTCELGALMEPVIDSNRPLVLTTCHCGNFFLSLLLFGSILPPKRRCTIVRTDRVEFDTRQWKLVLRSELGLYVDFLDTRSTRLAYHLLKRARNREILAILADLPSGYGRSTETIFFGRRAWFATGWIDLAHATDSIVIVFSPITEHRSLVELSALIDPKKYDSRTTFRAACLNAVTSMLESIIQAEPWSWMMFDSASAFFRNREKSVEPQRATDR